MPSLYIFYFSTSIKLILKLILKLVFYFSKKKLLLKLVLWEVLLLGRIKNMNSVCCVAPVTMLILSCSVQSVCNNHLNKTKKSFVFYRQITIKIVPFGFKSCSFRLERFEYCRIDCLIIYLISDSNFYYKSNWSCTCSHLL